MSFKTSSSSVLYPFLFWPMQNFCSYWFYACVAEKCISMIYLHKAVCMWVVCGLCVCNAFLKTGNISHIMPIYKPLVTDSDLEAVKSTVFLMISDLFPFDFIPRSVPPMLDKFWYFKINVDGVKVKSTQLIY